jgi:hypothetical protein
MKLHRLLIASVFVLLFTGCITDIGPSAKQNPPPARPLSSFSSFVLEPLVAAHSAGEIHQRAFTRIQQNVTLHVGALLQSWNSQAVGSGGTLVVSPTILELKFVSGGTRFFAGAFAGSSAVVMKLRLVDQSTGQEIANPEFFQRAAAMGGNYSLGATDNDMLSRIARVATRYLEENYAQAVGGPMSGYSGKN